VSASVLAGAQMAHDGVPFPKDIADLLGRGLATDPAARPEGVSELKKELSKILFAGNYAPTTFNLAFFMNNLFRGSTRSRRRRPRRKEPSGSTTSSRRLRHRLRRRPGRPRRQRRPPARRRPDLRFRGAPKSKAGLFIGIAVAAVAAGAGGWFLLGRKGSEPAGAGASSAAPPASNLQAAAAAMDPAASRRWSSSVSTRS